jgi:adenylate cyclase
VFGLHGDVIGALYGARLQQNLIDRGGITPVEAQLVQLLAAAVGANMARSLAARTRVQFEQFFSSELVRELERDPQLLEGRVEQVTILFSDLRGFTILSQRLGAEKTCRMVRDMMERLSERIVEHGGVIVDYAGDGILAMWNAPARQDDHAERACRAALAMLGELPALNARWAPETEGAPLALGIGINTGEAQVGNTGSTRKFKYGPHGHTVNLASRVQDATKHLGLPLLVSDSTRAQLGGGFVQRRLGQVRLPGVKEPVMLHEVLDASADSGWLALRESYERALGFYETAQWARTCEALMPLVAASPPSGPFDVPTLKLMRRAWECLESRPETFEPVLEVTAK